MKSGCASFHIDNQLRMRRTYKGSAVGSYSRPARNREPSPCLLLGQKSLLIHAIAVHEQQESLEEMSLSM